MVDVAAAELDMDPAELRRRNYVPTAAMPFKTGLTFTYDSGEFGALMDEAMGRADWAGAAARKAEAKARGRRRGIGMATYVEGCGGGPEDMAEVRVDPGGDVLVLVGTQGSGQGHETAYAQIASDRLGIPIERIRVHQGDTERIAFGQGSGGSRSLPVVGHAVLTATEKVATKARHIAAQLLEAADRDVELADGR